MPDDTEKADVFNALILTRKVNCEQILYTGHFEKAQEPRPENWRIGLKNI